VPERTPLRLSLTDPRTSLWRQLLAPSCRLQADPAGSDQARRGQPVPIQVGHRWIIERTQAWGNNYGKLRWCTERRQVVVEFWLALALAIITLSRLIRRAWTHYRWDSRPR
jgi:hypothetical protein